MIDREDTGSARRRAFGKCGVVAILLGLKIAGVLLVLGDCSEGSLAVSIMVGGFFVLTGGMLGILGWRDTWEKIALFLILCVIAIVAYMGTVHFFAKPRLLSGQPFSVPVSPGIPSALTAGRSGALRPA